MVVIAILSILIAASVAITGTLIDGAKVRQTRAMMQTLQLAIDQFKTDAPLDKIKPYRDRYGGYPADELEPFLTRTDPNQGIPEQNVAAANRRTIAVGAAAGLVLPPVDLEDYPNRPIRAMALTIKLHDSTAAAILGQISPKFRKPPGNPAMEFFDRDGNEVLDPGDEPLIYFVDAWGTPLDYFAVNPPANSNVDVPAPPDLPDGLRLATSRFLLTRNRGKPVLMSYGPDGPEQLAALSENRSDLVTDFNPTGPTPRVIDHPLNEDNVYLDETLRDRLKEPLAGPD